MNLDLRVNVAVRPSTGTVPVVIESPPSSPETRRLPTMTRGQATLVRIFCLFTVWVWATRIWNILGDDEHGAGFKVVHTVLALISVGLAVAVWFVVRKLRRPAGEITATSSS